MSDATVKCKQCGETAKMASAPEVDKENRQNIVKYECPNGHITEIKQPLG